VHNERCMPRSERGYGKPMTEKSRGARSLLLQSRTSIARPLSPEPLKHDLLRPRMLIDIIVSEIGALANDVHKCWR
jgi:hypothetical protein